MHTESNTSAARLALFSHFEPDLSGLDDVMALEESIYPLSRTRVIRPAVWHTAAEPQGTLSSRIHCIADESEGCITQSEWRERAKAHPAFAIINDELQLAFDTGALTAKFDELEKIGCEVFFDKSKSVMTLGLNLAKLRKGFNEISQLVDLRNKRVLNLVNGHNPLIDRNVAHVVPQLEALTFFVTFELGSGQ